MTPSPSSGHEPEEHPQCGGLARSVGPEEPGDPAGECVEIEGGRRRGRFPAERFRQPRAWMVGMSGVASGRVVVDGCSVLSEPERPYWPNRSWPMRSIGRSGRARGPVPPRLPHEALSGSAPGYRRVHPPSRLWEGPRPFRPRGRPGRRRDTTHRDDVPWFSVLAVWVARIMAVRTTGSRYWR